MQKTQIERDVRRRTNHHQSSIDAYIFKQNLNRRSLLTMFIQGKIILYICGGLVSSVYVGLNISHMVRHCLLVSGVRANARREQVSGTCV